MVAVVYIYRPLLTAMFPKQVDEATWDLAKGFAEALNSRMAKPTQSRI